MAKRKRLSPAVGLGAEPSGAADTGARPPIARIAGDAATAAAFDAVRGELEDAQQSGRLVMQLPLEAIDPAYLIRDRIEMAPDDMESLKHSLARRGQQTPIEVVDLGGGHYGLISGARRLKALEQLQIETGEARFGLVQALIRSPADRADTYIAMIEENEIRADLSYYERARIAFKAVEAGAFDSPKAALQGLFAGVSFSKRSKIKTFMALVPPLDAVLRFPAQLSERQGLALAKALADFPQLEGQLRDVLAQSVPTTATEEADLIEQAIKLSKAEPKKDDAPPAPVVTDVAWDIRMSSRNGRVVLEGAGVTETFIKRLEATLRRGE
ncbi:ParB N-terminal domain-containing protein [uncultured Tateyamaria sp.]|uniref:ParB/RepB/Spo0J family partition protein n=1 Tax=uncultured Tateyamaria sp. TaxID=455651 RepID=UPI002619504B|nr:ParB N-terminal domain-containing protein [uncultured Tateyamaria sp.]